MGTARHIAVAARASATRAAAAGSRSSPAGPVRGGAFASLSERGTAQRRLGRQRSALHPKPVRLEVDGALRSHSHLSSRSSKLHRGRPARCRFALHTARAEPPWARHSPSCCFRAASRPPHLQRWRWRAAARSSRRSAAYVASSTLSAPRGLHRERHQFARPPLVVAKQRVQKVV